MIQWSLTLIEASVIIIRPSPAAAPASSSHSHSYTLHFLFGEGLSYFTVVRVDCVVFLNYKFGGEQRLSTALTILFNKPAMGNTFILTNNPINGIMVIKGDESKAPLLSRVTVSHDVNDLNFSKLLEVIPQVGFFCIFFDASNKNLLNRYVCTWAVWVLRVKNQLTYYYYELEQAYNRYGMSNAKRELNIRWNCATKTIYLSGNCSFRLYHSSIHLMRTSRHGSINFFYRWISYKAKTPGSLAVRIPHDLKSEMHILN